MNYRVFSRPSFSIPLYFLLIVSLLPINTPAYGTMAAPSVYKRCNMERYSTDNVKIEGLVGFFPREMFLFMYTLKKAAQDLRAGTNSFPRLWKNCNTMLLHGREGNGQHTIARTIAEKTNSTLFEYSFSKEAGVRESPESYQARDEIQALFAKAKEHTLTHKQTVVIFIENIHIVGEDFWKNPKLPMGALWLELDGIVDNQNIVVITTSKTCHFISEPFIDRLGGKVMKIYNPNEEMRFELIKSFWSKFLKDTPCDDTILETLTDISDGLSIREIEELFQKTAAAVLSRDTESINEDFLLKQISSIQGRGARALLRELYAKAKKHGPMTLQAIVIIGIVIYGIKAGKFFGTKEVTLPKETIPTVLENNPDITQNI